MTNTLESKRTLWQQRINNWKISGLTQKAFCQKHQLNIHQFGYWNKRFNSDKSAPHKEQDKNLSPRNTPFIPVTLSNAEIRSALPSLELPNGMRIHGIECLSPDHLRHLAKALL